MNFENSFDRLVSGIGKEERLALLDKMKTTSLDNIAMAKLVTPDANDDVSDLDIRYKSESFFLRIWLFIKSVLTGTKPNILYNDLLIEKKSKAIGRKYPDLYDSKHRMLLTAFYCSIRELRLASDFFKAGISAYEDNPGGFYVFLGSLVSPALSEQIEKEASPYTLPFTKDPSPEVRASLIRKLDDLLQHIDPVTKGRLYEAVQGLEWLKQFVRLPFERFLGRFTSFSSGVFTCTLDTCSNELTTFTKVLTNPKTISPEVIETLFMFVASQNKHSLQETEKKQSANYEDVSITDDKMKARAEEFQEKSIQLLNTITSFVTNVPIKSITAVAFNSATWVSDDIDGAENWFVKFKNQWRKMFDRKWELWLKDRKKELVRIKTSSLFHSDEFPQIPNRPWTEVWGGIVCMREYTMGFLYGFYTILYPQISSTLKNLAFQGEFLIRENRIAFSDAYNEFNHEEQQILDINERLSEKGSLNITMENILKEGIRTIQNQGRMDALMLSIEGEVSSLASSFGANCRLVLPLLDGILHTKKTAQLDTIANLTTLNGKDNQEFRQKIIDSREVLNNALELLKDVEGIEIIS